VTAFQTAISVQHVDASGLRRIGPTAVRIAEAEGLQAHAAAVTIRMAALDSAGDAAGADRGLGR
jgi:histidinol dehydrogenase